MSGDDMAAQFVADLQGAFEIELCSGDPMLRGGHAERFGGGIDIEPGLAALDARGDHREANAVAGDRSAVRDGGAVVAASDPQPVQLALRRWRQADDLADVGDYTGEHYCLF